MGEDSKRVTARDVMRRDPPTVTREQTLMRAARLTEENECRELAVVEENVVVGIIARSDIEPHRGNFEWTTVGTVMTADPLVVAPDTPISAISRLLLEKGFNAVPVVSDGKFQGMVARQDLLRFLTPAE